MRLVVDYVGFEDNLGRAVVKEVSIVGVETLRLAHYVVKPPFPWEELNESARSANVKQTVSLHGIRWEEGSVEHSDLSKILTRTVERATALYAYGAVKCSVLQKLTNRTFIDLEGEFSAPTPKSVGLTSYTCLLPCHHISTYECSLNNALILAKWLHYYIDKLAINKLCSSYSLASYLGGGIVNSPGQC